MNHARIQFALGATQGGHLHTVLRVTDTLDQHHTEKATADSRVKPEHFYGENQIRITVKCC